jgi:glycosyltransferase involved in cell wall biosynthesis
MRIAQISPLIEPVPPSLYGGTERVVSFLTEGLVQRGHQVTLFASGDSRTHADLQGVRARSIRCDPEQPDPLAFHILELSQAFDRSSDFDIIHCHHGYLAFPFARYNKVPTVHTLHGRLDLLHTTPIMEYFHGIPLVSISNNQRNPLLHLGLRWMNTIYHGLPETSFRFGHGNGGYLVFLSRMSRDKRPDLAIEVAKRINMPLKLAGKIDSADRNYFEKNVKPFLRDSSIEYVGEIHESEKLELLGGALALIFPIDWPEPFGLVMIEAMACGTPVIARPYGSVPEIVKDGETGFIADTVEEMVEAVKRIGKINRERCFLTVQEQFSAEIMVERYEAVYRTLLNWKMS